MRTVRPFAAFITTAAVAAALLSASPSGAWAQTPPATPSATLPIPATPPAPSAPAPLRDPAPGDIVWTLAQEFPFLDERAAIALSSYVNPLVNTDPGVGILPYEPRHRSLMPSNQLTLLMEAAGLRPRTSTTPSALRVIGPCNFWVGEAPVGFASRVSLAKVADTIASSFVLGVRDLLNVPLERCIPTANAADAHVLVWVQGTRPPPNPERAAPTLLTTVQGTALTGAPVPAPAKTGTGAAGDPSLVDLAQAGALAALLLTLGSVVGARALARRRG